MMNNTEKIWEKINARRGQIAVLIDPEKLNCDELSEIIEKANFAQVDYFFVGGSTVTKAQMSAAIETLRKKAAAPVVIFPGDHQQIVEGADAILYLSLISGRNPEYLIGQHVLSARAVFDVQAEIIPTGYILIDGGTKSSVAYVSQTTPIPQQKPSIAVNTAIAGALQGKRLIYFDAGSGAKHIVNDTIINDARAQLPEVPIIVGGGVRAAGDIEKLARSGANVIVIGNHIEKDSDFLLDIHAYAKNRPR